MLCGRDPERARIRELLDGARESRSGALVILGEPGRNPGRDGESVK
jgi:hypothetical protein